MLVASRKLSVRYLYLVWTDFALSWLPGATVSRVLAAGFDRYDVIVAPVSGRPPAMRQWVWRNTPQ